MKSVGSHIRTESTHLLNVECLNTFLSLIATLPPLIFPTQLSLSVSFFLRTCLCMCVFLCVRDHGLIDGVSYKVEAEVQRRVSQALNRIPHELPATSPVNNSAYPKTASLPDKDRMR